MIDVPAPHPSEALLTRFNPQGLHATAHRSSTRTAGFVAGLHLIVTVFTVALAWPAFAEPSLAWLFGAIAVGFQLLMLGAWWGVRHAVVAQTVALDGRQVVLTYTYEHGPDRVVRIPTRSIATAHVLERRDLHRTYLRIIQDDGTEYAVWSVAPTASVQWLAHQISHAARLARAQPQGVVAPEMLELLDEQTRHEARRKQLAS